MLSNFIFKSFIETLNNYHLDFTITEANKTYLLTIRNLPIDLDLQLAEAKYEDSTSNNLDIYMKSACCIPAEDTYGNRIINVILDDKTGCKKMNKIGRILLNYFDANAIVSMEKSKD